MKYALIVLLALGLTTAAQAQITAQVTNFTGCTVQVTTWASPNGCGLTCQQGPFCLFPGQTMAVTCGLDFWTWDLVRVVPTTDDCSVPCPGGAIFASPIGCFGFPQVNFGNHCHCGPITVDFSNPNIVNIF